MLREDRVRLFTGCGKLTIHYARAKDRKDGIGPEPGPRTVQGVTFGTTFVNVMTW